MAFSTKLSSLTDELVEVIANTTSRLDPARFDALRESSLRKLRQHSFLRTNQFEVYSSLDGYEERFRVQNRERIADALRDSLDALADYSKKWTPDVLHLLLELADQPVQKSNLEDLELLRKSKDDDLEPRLKWSDIAKEDGWDDDGELWRNADLAGYSSDNDYADHESNESTRSEETSLSSIEARYRKQPTDYTEIRQTQSCLDEIRKSQAWRCRQREGSPIAPSHSLAITEIQAIREILFMLSGLENGLFNRQGEPLPDIQLTQASPQVFRSLLASASNAGRGVSLLRRYVKHPQEIPLLQVFRAAIDARLGSFDKTIANMQAHYCSIDRDFVASIMKLLNDLDPHLHLLEILAKTIEKLDQSKNSPPFYYLELLFNRAQALQLEGDESAYHFISQLFFECFAVYLRPIRRWMQSGVLSESDKTFFISRSPVDVPWSQAWAHQFKLKRTPQGSLYAPQFLQPAASRIFTTGKSIVILKLLGKHWPTQEEGPEPTTQVDMSAVSSFVPFSEIFKNMFDAWMKSKRHAASATLRQTLFQTYNLWSELDMLQHVYLMSDGSRSDLFADAVFENIDILNAYWHDRFNLTEIAREAFDGLIEPHRLNASTSSDSSAAHVNDVRRTVRKGLPSIRITYRLPWLSRIVLSDESLDHYQLVFTFLLQLRRASRMLTRHRIVSDDLTYKTAEQEIFYGLRSKLLWFCNAIQSYLSTLVLGPLAVKFTEEMKQAEDIDQMIMSHSTFTKRMINEACLGKKLDPIRQAILDIFDLAIKLQDARQIESDRMAEEAQELSRLSVMSMPRRDGPTRYVEAGEEEDETFLGEQGKDAMTQDTEIPYSQVLGEIRSDLDRHLKFICGGLRGVARASNSEAASKWDILAEMLEVGIRGIQ
ncbi:putative Spc97 Spc98 family protein [Rosellinia necatrix]|uniref:Spindle pole body component n=1 Tax=Rosellinia necatrix TaxID=77044 RepID=A0A1S7ULH8_ROSNE|nr:putative Spc97 Spc98 family protein [Rosellinia necatrix]